MGKPLELVLRSTKREVDRALQYLPSPLPAAPMEDPPGDDPRGGAPPPVDDPSVLAQSIVAEKARVVPPPVGESLIVPSIAVHVHDISMGDCEGLTAGCRRRISPSPASPLENEDILSGILLRLPPAPSSIPRASVVCKLWRRLVSDPAFLRRFRARHSRNPPLLGFFFHGSGGISFLPTLEPPDRIPPEYFSLPLDERRQWIIICCRHGLVLLYHLTKPQILVWDPVTGDRHHIALPPKIAFGGRESIWLLQGAVLRVAGDVDDGGRPSNFKVVLVGNDKELTRVCACVYSSNTGMWGDLISTACPSKRLVHIPSTLVGGSLYWLLFDTGGSASTSILEFDLDKQCPAVIEMPLEVYNLRGYYGQFRVMRSKGGELGFLFLSSSTIQSSTIQLWKRVSDSDGGARWVLERTIDICKLLSLNTDKGFIIPVNIWGFEEEDNVLLLKMKRRERISYFMIQLDSMKLEKACLMDCYHDGYYPFTCVYAAGMGIGGRQVEAELLQKIEQYCPV